MHEQFPFKGKKWWTGFGRDTHTPCLVQTAFGARRGSDFPGAVGFIPDSCVFLLIPIGRPRGVFRLLFLLLGWGQLWERFQVGRRQYLPASSLPRCNRGQTTCPLQACLFMCELRITSTGLFGGLWDSLPKVPGTQKGR